MRNAYCQISDIAILTPKAREKDEFMSLLDEGVLTDPDGWSSSVMSGEITGLTDGIASRMKYSMSSLSLGIYNVLDRGPFVNMKKTDEIILFTGFAEIEAVNKIGKLIMEQDYTINPALFPNSVAHVSLSYFTILKKISNYTVAVNDGLNTGRSFVNFIIDRAMIPVDYVVAAGEERSLFFSYEINRELDIVPSFVSYKVSVGKEKGFRFAGTYKDIKEVTGCGAFKSSDRIFCDRESFGLLSGNEGGRRIYCEYPFVRDNPCGVILRLALPFFFGFTGRTAVIEKIGNDFYLFEVVI
jgi:hypothetical protein